MVVDDYDMELDAFLAADRAQCLFKVLLLIPRGDDDASCGKDTINFALREWFDGACARDRDFEQDEKAHRKQGNKRREEEQGLH
jgi:hypothetical protein